MASYSWSAGTSGNWSDPANWTPSGVPGAADLATVSAPGGYEIYLDVAAIGSLTLDAPDATINPVGPLALSGVLDVQAGTFTVNNTITGGTIRPDGGTITYSAGTLDGVTLDGPLDLSATGDSVTIKDGIAFAGPAPEQILLTGYDSGLDFADAETLNNVAIAAESTSTLGTGLGLTLGASSSLTIDGGYPGAPRSAFFGAAITGSLLDNKGTVTVDGPLDDAVTTTLNEGSFVVDGGGQANLVQGVLGNSGTLEVSGAGVGLTVGGTLTNSGSVSLASGATLVLDGELANTGTIALAPGTSLYVDGSETFDQLGTIDRNGGMLGLGQFTQFGELDLSGHVLHVTPGGEFDGVLIGDEVTDGTIELDGGTVTFESVSGFGATVDLEVSETYDQFGANGYLFGAAVEIGSGGMLDLSGRTLHVSVGENFGAEFDGLILAGTVTGGTIELDGGPITYAGGTLDGVTLDGPLDLDTSGASLTIGAGGLAFTGTAPAQISIANASLTIQDAETLDNANVVLGAGSDLHFLGAPLTIGATTTVAVTGAADVVGSVDNDGTIDVTTGSLPATAAFFSTFQLENDGLLIFDGSSDNTIDLVNNAAGNLVLSNGAELALDTVTNAGTIQISTGATLELPSTAVNFGTVTFEDGSGTLGVSGSATADGTLADFVRGDAILLRSGGLFPTMSHTGNMLDVLEGSGNVVDRFALVGQDYTDASFTLSNVGETFTITTDAPCYCAGTRILTPRGERPVETLQVGDLVVTRQHGVDAVMPIRWIGHRRLVLARHPEPEQVAPVRIGRDAVGPGQPCRDLYLSPDHAIHLDGMLIQARQLVNGMTIRRDAARAVVTYHHVELDRHAILVADGLPCESYLDTGNRTQFDAGSVVALHAGVGPGPERSAASCAPLATDAVLVRPVWDRLAERAVACGHLRPDPVVTRPDLLLEAADGTRLEQAQAADGRIRFRLPPGCRQVRLRSGSDRPTTLSPWCDDRRRLGIALSAITLRQGAWQQDLPLDGLRPESGWWPVESAGNLSWRWSDGDALVELPDTGDTLDIALHAVMPVVEPEAVRLKTG